MSQFDERFSCPRPLLIMVEGRHDVSFLVRIAEVLRNEAGVPDLGELDQLGRIIFIPTSGEMRQWAFRFAPLQCSEYHVYDREMSPLTEERQHLVRTIRQRPTCIATLTSKRAIENYLHEDAIAEATALRVVVEDDNDVPAALAKQILSAKGVTWQELDRRRQTRLRNRIKRLLTTTAVEFMTVERLAERDPRGEVLDWLRTIASLARHAREQ